MQNPLKILSADDVIAFLRSEPHAARRNYLAFYSSWYGGVIKDPQLMMLPIDDHVVHRGDGVFEAIKCTDRKIFALDRHLERLFRSADLIGLKPPNTLAEIRDIAVETVRISGARDCLLRMYVSRGPGGFTTNPYECIASQYYLVITPSRAPTPESYRNGVSLKVSSIKVKEGIFATVKSCNYLPNVMMKKEALDAGVDFTVSIDEDGFLAESSTENFAIVSEHGELLVPNFSRTLRGVTAVRVMELAESLVSSGELRGVKNSGIRREDVFKAREAMMLGTTLDVLPVTKFEGGAVAGGGVGPVCLKLLDLLRKDMRSGPLVHDV